MVTKTKLEIKSALGVDSDNNADVEKLLVFEDIKELLTQIEINTRKV